MSSLPLILRGFIFFALFSLISGRVVYVSVTGDNSNNGDETSPVADIPTAYSLLSADNDTIVLLPGQFSVTSTVALELAFSCSIVGQQPSLVGLTSAVNIFNISASTGGARLSLSGINFNIIDSSKAAIISRNANISIVDCKFDGVGRPAHFVGSVVSLAGSTVFASQAPMLFENCLNGTIINNCSFQQCTNGAVEILASESDFRIQDSFFFECSAQNGSAIRSESPISVARTTFEANVATDRGGSLWLGAGDSTVTDSTFSSNSARIGGAIYVYSAQSPLSLIGSKFSGNSASLRGGAVALFDAADFLISATQFTSNSASNDGGALFISTAGQISIISSTFDSNRAAFAGGAAAFQCASCSESLKQIITIRGNTLFQNNLVDPLAAEAHGGALSLAPFSETTIDGSTFKYNNISTFGDPGTSRGGAISCVTNRVDLSMTSTTLSIYASSFTSNNAFSSVALGGAIAFHCGGLFTVSGTTFTSNTVPDPTQRYFSMGGAISVWADGANKILTNLTSNAFSFNAANFGSAVAIQRSYTSIITSNTFTSNVGYVDGGALSFSSMGTTEATGLQPYASVSVNTFTKNVFGVNWQRNTGTLNIELGASAIVSTASKFEPITVELNGNTMSSCYITKTTISICYAAIGYSEFAIIPTAAQAAATTYSSPVLRMYEGSKLNLTLFSGKTITLPQFWAEAVTPSELVNVLVGNNHITLTGGSSQTILLGCHFIGVPGSGRMVALSGSSILRDALTFSDINFVINSASYATFNSIQLTLNRANVTNNGNTGWAEYYPGSSITGNGGAVIINNYALYFTSAVLTSVYLDQRPNAAMVYAITDGATSGTLITGPGSGVINMQGAFYFDTTRIRNRQPSSGSQYVFLDCPDSIVKFDFASAIINGEYTFTTQNDSHRMTVTITGFGATSSLVNTALNGLLVTFPRNTNGSGISTCEDLLHAETLSMVDLPTCVCDWVAPNRVLITSNSLPFGGKRVRFITGSITDQFDPTLFVVDASSTQVVFPSYIQFPELQYAITTTSSDCVDLAIDLSSSLGLGVFNRTYSWMSAISTPTLPAADSQALLGYMGTQHEWIITIPANLLPAVNDQPTEYVIKQALTAQLTAITVGYNIDIPFTRIPIAAPVILPDGPKVRLVFSSAATVLSPRVVVPPCTNLASADLNQPLMDYFWNVSGPTPVNYTTYGPSLTILPYSLVPGKKYQFNLTAVFTWAPSIATTLPITVVVVAEPLVVFPAMGGYRMPIEKSNISVAFYDPNEQLGTVSASMPQFSWDSLFCPSSTLLFPANITFQNIANDYGDWINSGLVSKIVPRNLRCYAYGFVGSVVVTWEQYQSIETGANWFYPGFYILSAYVTKGGNTGGTLVALQIDPNFTDPRDVFISPDFFRAKAIAHEKLTIRGQIENLTEIPADHWVEWKIINDFTFLLDNPDNILTSRNQLNLVLKPDSLKPGVVYPFQLNLYNSTNHLRGSNVLWLSVNSVPGGGIFRVKGIGGAALRQGQPAKLAADRYTDEDVPLRYLFSMSRDGVEDIILTNGAISLDTLDLERVPVYGRPENDYQVTFKARILDSYNAQRIITTRVRVLPPETAVDIAATLAAFKRAALDQDFLAASNLALLLLNVPFPSQADKQIAQKQIVDGYLLPTAKSTGYWTMPHIQFFVSTLQQLSISALDSPLDQALAGDLLQVIELVIQGATNSVGPAKRSITPLSVWSSSDSRQALNSLASALSNLIRSSRDAFVPYADRVLADVKALVDIQLNASVVNERAAEGGDERIKIFTEKADQSGNEVSVNLGDVLVTIPRANNFSQAVSTEAMLFRNGTFPVGDSKSGGIPIAAVAIKLSQSGTGIDVSSATGLIIVSFPRDAVEMPSPGNMTCGSMKQGETAWSTEGCTTILKSDGSIECQCTQSRNLAVLFGALTTDPFSITPSESSPDASPSSVIGNGGGSVDIGGSAIGGIIAGVVVGAAAVTAIVIVVLKKAALAKQLSAMRAKLLASRAGPLADAKSAPNSPASSSVEMDVPRTLRWTRATKPDVPIIHFL